MQFSGGQRTILKRVGMLSSDCSGCYYVCWAIGVGQGVLCFHPKNQKYNPKLRKYVAPGEEDNYLVNKATIVKYIPDGCQLRKERVKKGS